MLQKSAVERLIVSVRPMRICVSQVAEVSREKSLDAEESMYIHSSAIRRSSLQDRGALTNVAKKKKKKDAQLVLRLNKQLRNRFVDACQELDTTAAREVRRFIKQFLKRYDNGELDE